MVLDSRSWVEHLPSTIEAIFFVRRSGAQESNGVRANLIREFELSEDLAPPVVQYDLTRAPSPFVLWQPPP